MQNFASILVRTLIARNQWPAKCQRSLVLPNISREDTNSSLRPCGVETSLLAGTDLPVSDGELFIAQIRTAARLGVLDCAQLASYLNRLLAREGILTAICFSGRGGIPWMENTTTISRVAIGSSDMVASHKKQCRRAMSK